MMVLNLRPGCFGSDSCIHFLGENLTMANVNSITNSCFFFKITFAQCFFLVYVFLLISIVVFVRTRLIILYCKYHVRVDQQCNV